VRLVGHRSPEFLEVETRDGFEIRNPDAQDSTRRDDPVALPQKGTGLLPREMLEHVGMVDRREYAVAEGQSIPKIRRHAPGRWLEIEIDPIGVSPLSATRVEQTLHESKGWKAAFMGKP